MDCGPKQVAARGTESGTAYKLSQRTQPLQHRGRAQEAECDGRQTAGAKGGTGVPTGGGI